MRVASRGHWNGHVRVARRRCVHIWRHMVRMGARVSTMSWMSRRWSAWAWMQHVRWRHVPMSRRLARRTPRLRCRCWSNWLPTRGRTSSLLPCLVGNTHGKVSTSLVLDLSSLVNQCLRSSVVETVGTLALGSTEYSSLETLKEKKRRRVRFVDLGNGKDLFQWSCWM